MFPLVQIMKPNKTKKANTLVRISLFAILTFVGTLIQIPAWPVPISMQTFFVMLSGLLLGPVAGATSQLVYITMGLAGLPVFTGGGGVGYIFTPRFGFVLGFIVLAYISGLVKNRNKLAIPVLILGNMVLYFIGTTYIWVLVNMSASQPVAFWGILKTMAVFIPGDVIKIIVSLILSIKVQKRLNVY